MVVHNRTYKDCKLKVRANFLGNETYLFINDKTVFEVQIRVDEWCSYAMQVVFGTMPSFRAQILTKIMAASWIMIDIVRAIRPHNF